MHAAPPRDAVRAQEIGQLVVHFSARFGGSSLQHADDVGRLRDEWHTLRAHGDYSIPLLRHVEIGLARAARR